MPRSPLTVLSWSPKRNLFELYNQGRLERDFQREDEAQWLAWLTGQTSFTFQDLWGRLNVYKERRSRGTAYWYAYHVTGKRYLGQTANVTLSRLQRETQHLSTTRSPIRH